jgi:predicted nucleic-acid-binding protein
LRINADTNLLLRALVKDDAAQYALAEAELARAAAVVITLPTLCEIMWVLTRAYRRHDAADLLRGLLAIDGVVLDWPAVQAGLLIVEAGGDFADGVIAHLGRAAGAETFVSFDQKAVALLAQCGHAARVPAATP